MTPVRRHPKEVKKSRHASRTSNDPFDSSSDEAPIFARRKAAELQKRSSKDRARAAQRSGAENPKKSVQEPNPFDDDDLLCLGPPTSNRTQVCSSRGQINEPNPFLESESDDDIFGAVPTKATVKQTKAKKNNPEPDDNPFF